MTASLLGYGSHGKDIEAIWMRLLPQTALAIYDEKAHPLERLESGELAWKGVTDPRSPLLPIGNTARWYVGVNNPSQRRAIVERLKLEGAEPLVDRSAIVGWCGEACPGVVVAPNVTLLRDVKLGVHTHVNYNSGLTRCEIGDFVTIGPGVTICGDVTVGDGTFIGAGAVVKHLVTIGKDVTIGAGAVVVKDVADGATVKGVPAK